MDEIKNDNTIIVSATAGKKEDTLLYKSIKNEYIFDFCEDNREGLGIVYNRFIQDNKDLYKWIVFIHDDVSLNDVHLEEKFENNYKKLGYDIQGVAGGVDPVLKPPFLWHIMCGGLQNNPNVHGEVAHYHEGNKILLSKYGSLPARVAIIDGVFMAVRTECFLKTDLKFDEQFDFHLYDIDFSLQANKNKLKIGVVDINLIHKSHGLTERGFELFNKNQEKFCKKYIN